MKKSVVENKMAQMTRAVLTGVLRRCGKVVVVCSGSKCSVLEFCSVLLG